LSQIRSALPRSTLPAVFSAISRVTADDVSASLT
jgi:hypothetical protein